MSVRRVILDDVRNTRRSHVVLGVIGLLTVFVALIVYSVESYHSDGFRALFDVSFFFFLVFPLILIPLTYLSIAGDRERGSIKHTLGLPISRAEYVAGKYLSRAAVALTAVLVATAVAVAPVVALYTNPIDPVRFAWFGVVSALFVASMTAIFVAFSALTARRSRAMVGVIGAYFILGPFWFGGLPVVSLQTVVDGIASLLGTSVSETTYGYIRFSSPATAYLNGLEPVYEGVIGSGQYPQIDQNYGTAGDELYGEPWYSWTIMVAWGSVALALSYVRFRVAELG